MAWIVPTGEDPWAMLTDSSKCHVLARVQNPDQYNDTMAEVFYWSWIRSKGLNAELVELEGHPDIRIDAVDSTSTWVEVKRIRLGTSPARMRRVIKKANRQLRAADPNRSGVVMISIERAAALAALDLAVPADISPYIEEARRELVGQFGSHVAKVIVLWDELAIDVAVGSAISYRLRRRCTVLAHRSPASVPAVKNDDLAVKMSTDITMRWPESLDHLTGHGPRLGYGSWVVGPGFREFNASTDGVRPHHAISAAMDFHAEYRHHLRSGGTVSFITRRITAVRRPHTLLLIASDLSDGRREIGEAYKLYDDDLALTLDPLRAFLTFVERYGAPTHVSVGESVATPQAKLIMAATIRTRERNIGIAAPADGGHYLSGRVLVQFTEDLPGFTIELVYLVDVAKYRADVIRHSR